jgi:hypothetical protein
MTTYYKLLNTDGSACNGGTGRWHLPTTGGPGKWMRRIKDPCACQRGYHLVTIEHVLEWQGAALFRAEYEGACDYRSPDKIAVERARLTCRIELWNERILRLFAADCAERVLPIFERQRPGDDRPSKAIVAARAYANGVLDEQAWAAAGAAARAAAWVAAGAAAAAAAAARDAAWAAAGAAAGAAAWAAAGAAAAAAARDAAGAAAAERAWQVSRLKEMLEIA